MAHSRRCAKGCRGGQVVTMDGQTHEVGKWDLLIAHPPCTYLTVSGNRWFSPKYGDKAALRAELRIKAAEFFMALMNADIDKIAVENPVGYMSTPIASLTVLYSRGNLVTTHAKKKRVCGSKICLD